MSKAGSANGSFGGTSSLTNCCGALNSLPISPGLGDFSPVTAPLPKRGNNWRSCSCPELSHESAKI